MRLTRPAGVGLGLAMIWFSMLALLPLIAVVVETADAGWTHFVTTVTEPQTYAALTLTVVTALIITIINTVMGTMIAWVLVRDRFPGRRVLEVVIDIPFALPTIVAGLVLLSLYGPQSPLGINIANTRIAVGLAFLFVTLPFVVRTVQPVLADMDRDVEQAAASLGATPRSPGGVSSCRRCFRRWRLGPPCLLPVRSASMARWCFYQGNLPMRTEAGSVRILSYLENGDQASAAAIATMLLAVSFTVIVFLDVVQRKAARRG